MRITNIIPIPLHNLHLRFSCALPISYPSPTNGSHTVTTPTHLNTTHHSSSLPCKCSPLHMPTTPNPLPLTFFSITFSLSTPHPSPMLVPPLLPFTFIMHEPLYAPLSTIHPINQPSYLSKPIFFLYHHSLSSPHQIFIPPLPSSCSLSSNLMPRVVLLLI